MKQATVNTLMDHMLEHGWGAEEREAVLNDVRAEGFSEERIQNWLKGIAPDEAVDEAYNDAYFYNRTRWLLDFTATAIAMSIGCSCPTIELKSSIGDQLIVHSLELVETADGSYDIEDYHIS